MLTTFFAVVPVFLVILAGVIVDRLNALPEDTGRMLSLFSINVSCPCLIFHIMSEARLDQLAPARWWLGVMGTQVLVLLAVRGIERLRGSADGPAMTAGLSASFCNAGFVGLSVIMNIFPGSAPALTAAGLAMVACNAVIIAGQMSLMGWSRKQRMGRHHLRARLGFRRRLWRFIERFILANGILMATIAGLAVGLAHIPVWEPLDRGIAMLGNTAPPTMLFTMGLCLRAGLMDAVKNHGVSLSGQAWLCVWKLVLLPAATLGVMLLLNIDPLWTCVSVVIAATGTGILVSTMAQVYDAAPGQAALTVGVTNILSLFSLTAVLWLMERMDLLPAELGFHAL